MKTRLAHFGRIWVLMASCIASTGGGSILAQTASATKALPKVGTSTVVGKFLDVAVEVTVQSPSSEPTPLQIACVFEYQEGDIFTSPPALPAALNGMVHVDQQLHGLITELRKSGRFVGHALETLLIIPPEGTIAAQKLLLIGLGDRSKFTPDLMVDVGRVGMREALRLGVPSYAHASDLKDGGVDPPTALVAANVVKGAYDAYRTELFLKEKKATTFHPLTKFALLAGPAFFEPSRQAAAQAIQDLGK
jgi:hypothetical protein